MQIHVRMSIADLGEARHGAEREASGLQATSPSRAGDTRASGVGRTG
jgi:hypothetical protein